MRQKPVTRESRSHPSKIEYHFIFFRDVMETPALSPFTPSDTDTHSASLWFQQALVDFLSVLPLGGILLAILREV